MGIFDKKLDVKAILAEQDQQIVDLKRSLLEKDQMISSLKTAVGSGKQKNAVSEARKSQVKRLKRKIERQDEEKKDLANEVLKLKEEIVILTRTARNSKDRARRFKDKLDKLELN